MSAPSSRVQFGTDGLRGRAGDPPSNALAARLRSAIDRGQVG